jgi:DNA repair exonuclease SbcCD ATPase subunit
MAEVLHEMNLHIMDLEYQIMRLQDQQKDNARQSSTLTASIDLMEQDLERLAKQYSATAAEEFSFSMDLTCPTCGQPIPGHLQAKMREEAENEFIQRKTSQLQQINASIEDVKARLAEVQAIAQDLDKSIQELASQEALKRAELDALRIEYSNLEKSAPEPPQPGLADQTQYLERQLAKIEQKKAAGDRIAELMDEERKLAAEFENIEGELFVTEEFVREKVRLLEDKINSKFEIARFKLFNVLVNGGVEECCETTVNGVPWMNLNRGAKMNAGLDIIRTLQDRYNFRCPVWIDNAEAVTKLVPMRCQMFRLFVDSRYPKLFVKETEI